ncbi:MAG: hypothetical protein ACYCSN_15095, partial [Acidobacteriaceae bacterium]
ARSKEALDQAITELLPRITSQDAQAWFRLRFGTLEQRCYCSSRHFSQGLIFAWNGGSERAWRVVFRQAIALEAFERLREGIFSAPQLDVGHRSAAPIASGCGKGLFGGVGCLQQRRASKALA